MELVMLSSHLILCHPLLLLPSIFRSIRVFSNESTLCMRWPKHWSFNFIISPSSEHPGLISFRMDWLDLLAVQGTCKSLLQYHCSKSINSLVLSFLYSPTLTSIHDYWKNHVLRKSKLSWKQTFYFCLYLNSKTNVHTLCLWCALQPVKDLSRIVSSSAKPSRALFDLMAPTLLQLSLHHPVVCLLTCWSPKWQLSLFTFPFPGPSKVLTYGRRPVNNCELCEASYAFSETLILQLKNLTFRKFYWLVRLRRDKNQTLGWAR